MPDLHDEVDFDIPKTQAELERFMSTMSKLADDEYYLSQSVCFNSLPDPSSFSVDFHQGTVIYNASMVASAGETNWDLAGRQFTRNCIKL